MNGDRDRVAKTAEKVTRDVRDRLREVLTDAELPFGDVMALSEQVHGAIRTEILDAVKHRVRSGSHREALGTYEAKADFATWLNRELRHAGLAIQCPKTSKPTFLEVVRAPVPERGRFRFDHMDSRGIHHQTLSSVVLPELDFVNDPTVRPAGRRREGGRER